MERGKRVTELCIIGAAGAGMSAAVAAAQRGVRDILVLEKMKSTGGCMKLSMGMMAIDSPLQRKFGLDYPVDEAYRDLMRILNWRCDAKLVRKWLAGSGENIAWLTELGLGHNYVTTETADLGKFRHTHHRFGEWDGNRWRMKAQGPILTKGLTEACGDYGVEILTQTRAKRLIKDAAGKITGVLCEDAAGGALEVEAKAVILATGSISSNEQLIRRFYATDEYRDVHIMAQIPHNTGDGLIMAEEAGAAAGATGTLFIGPHNHYPGASELIGMLMRRPHPIKVNTAGERFVDESIPFEEEFGWMQCLSVDVQPGKKCYVVMDQAYIDAVTAGTETMPARNDDSSMLHSPPQMGAPIEIEKGKDPLTWRERVMEHFRYEEQRGAAVICGSTEEAAAFIGCDAAVLKSTIESYNADCARGYDTEFLKAKEYLTPVEKPPYYVILGRSGIDTCLGGLKVDNHQRVMTPDGGVIPGLYAAGVMCSGWFNGAYCFFGSEMSFTIFSGRNAAKEAAGYIG
jgi:fumarate reductase flavoprotein subunit